MSKESLMVGASAYCNWPKIESVMQLLSNKGQVCAAQLETLPAKLLDNSEQQVILFYSDFSYALSQILKNDHIDINEAAEAWRASLETLQGIYRAHRNQVLLFELNEVIASPQLFLETCWLKLGYEGAAPNYELSLESESEPLVEAWAQKWLAQSPLLNQLNEYTRAMAWPLVETSRASELDIEQALTQLQYLFSFQTKHQQLSEELKLATQKVVQLEEQETKLNLEKNLLNEEGNLVLKQLHKVQEEVENKYISEKNLTEKIALLEKENIDLIEKLKEEREANNKEKKEFDSQVEIKNKNISDLKLLEKNIKINKTNLLEENNLLLEQLHLVQEEIEKQFIAKKVARDHLDSLQKNLNLQETLVEELTSENTVLTKLLHSTQEELEKKSNQASVPPAVSTALVQVPESASYLPVPVSTRPKGFLARRAIKKEKRRTRRMDLERATVLAQSPWFNEEWYLAQNPDIASDEKQAGNPALHYVRHGGFEGRNPSPHFDSAFYLAENSDVAESGMNPLWHFLQNGQAEGRQPHP